LDQLLGKGVINLVKKRILILICFASILAFAACGSGSPAYNEDFAHYHSTTATTDPSVIYERPESTRTTPPTPDITTPPNELPTQNNSSDRMGLWDEIEIIGSDRFVLRSENALNTIRDGSPYHWDMVLRYLGILREYSSSGMWYWLNPPEFRVGNTTFNASTIWYASTIVHDAWHSWQAYHYDENPFIDPYSDEWFDAEMDAMRVQIEFLQAINAPQHYITHAESMIGQRWWLGPITW